MIDEKRATASAPPGEAAPPRPPPAPAKSESAADLDLAVEEIKKPERMKEGFVGQER